MAETPLFLLFVLCLSRRLCRATVVEKHRKEGMATKEEVDEKAGARNTGIVVPMAEAEEIPRVTAAIVTVVGSEVTEFDGVCIDQYGAGQLFT